MSHDAETPGLTIWHPLTWVTFKTAPGSRTAHVCTSRTTVSWLLLPSSQPGPTLPATTFRVLVNSSSCLEIAQAENIAVILNNFLCLTPHVAPIRISCWLKLYNTARTRPLFTTAASTRVQDPIGSHLLPSESLWRSPPPLPPSPYCSFHPTATSILIKGKSIHVTPLLRRFNKFPPHSE